MRFQELKISLSALAVASLAACGGGGTDVSGNAGTGSVRFALTDAPACGYDAVRVTIQKIRVHQSDSANDTDTGWSEVVLNPAKRVDLLSLTNGVLSELGQTPLPAGKYTQMRLVLAANDSAHPLLNSVVPTGGTEVALKSPSGQQSGVKANINIDISANQMADFVIDFDACKSVVSAGNSGQYLLKPVVSVIPRYVSGVAGFVNAATSANGNASVSLQQGGAVIKSTVPDSTGKFLLQPVAPGSYTMVLVAPGRTTAVVTGVIVAAQTITSVNGSGTALNPPASPSGTLAGSATVDTFMRVSQSLTGGPTVETASRYADSTTASYSFAMPTNAPLVASYVALPGALVFAPDAPAAGRYTLNASLSGFFGKTIVLGPLAANTTVVSNITFP